MNYKLIEAKENDKETIFKIKKRSIKPYVEQMFGWDEDWQRQFVYRNYKPENIVFIVVGNEQVGILEVLENDEEIFLKNILIVEAYQGKGIGRNILHNLINKANEQNKPIKLEVLAINKRAEAFYSRLGFKVEERTNIKVCMRLR